MRFLSKIVLVVAGVAAALASCGKGGNGGDGGSSAITCDPGENIFCRCPGGEAGTKQCQADGKGFDACVTREGVCPDISTSSSSSSSSSSSGTGGSAGGGGGTGGSVPTGHYLGYCAKDTDCDSGKCRFGYCTKDCAKFDECTLGTGECVAFSGEQVCMPVCTVTADCLNWYGDPSACGYTTAVDGTPVTTCSDWQANLKVPPAGTNCTEDVACSLGNVGVQSVCSFGTCTTGCYGSTDCPPNTNCSSTTNLGHCQ